MINRDTILLACGTEKSRASLRSAFEDRYNLLEAANSAQTMLLLQENQGCIATMLLNITEEKDAGFEILKIISKSETLSKIPVMVIIENSDVDEWRAFELGASDVIRIPFTSVRLQHRVQNIIELMLHKWDLEKLVEQQAQVLRQSNEVLMDTLSSIIEYRSAESGQHILRIRRFTQILLEEVAHSCPEYGLSEKKIQMISSAAALHDIGKISIPDAILNKPGPLTPKEREQMETHAAIGAQILNRLKDATNEEYIQEACNICRCHHERWDGHGYPDRLVGDEIPIGAQVVGLTDAYDALTTDRVYKKAYSHEKSASMILNGECGSFSPKLLECFKEVADEFAQLSQEYSDGRSPKLDPIAPPRPTPIRQTGIDSLQRIQDKYQAILHYTNATVMEVDLSNSIYHMVYNPDSNLILMNKADTFDGIKQILLDEIVIPEDRENLRRIFEEEIPHDLMEGIQRKYYYFRVYGQENDTPLYRMAFLRTENRNTDSNRVLIIYQSISSHPIRSPKKADRNSVSEEEACRFLDSLCLFRRDPWLTLCHIGKELPVLLGYTQGELEEQFQNRLLNLVHPEDREKLLKSIKEQLDFGTEIQLEYRLLHKAGHYIWVLNKGHRFLDRDGQEYLYGILINISQGKAAEEELRLSLERHSIILSKTESVIFETDINTKKVTFSQRWNDIFGYEPLDTDFKDRIYTESHLHPDDMPVFMEKLHHLQNGASSEKAEVRIAKADGRYLWCQIHVIVQYDRDGTPLKYVGILTNIDESKRAQQELKFQAEADSLTGLLNKASGKNNVKEYISTAQPDSRGALLILDLDNFKGINDQYGHMFGDVVLTQTANEIKRLFRSGDVVARIGGDEFMVFMKNIQSQALIEKRLRQLILIFDTMLYEQVPDCRISCSVGVAVYPENGETYEELFYHADQALYQVKAKGKRSFQIYNDSMVDFPSDGPKRESVITAPIDSDVQPALTYENLVEYAFHRLYQSKDLHNTLKNIMDFVGRRIGASRMYVFENNKDNTACINTYEWCNVGIKPRIREIPRLSYETELAGYESNFGEDGMFYCHDTADLPAPGYEFMRRYGVKSTIQRAIREHHVFRGFIGFDECISNSELTPPQMKSLSVFSEILSLFLQKMRMEEKQLSAQMDSGDVFDNQEDWVYVVDPDTYELKYANSRIRSYHPDIENGMLCYQCLGGKEKPCSFCPIGSTHEGSDLMQNMKATPICWDGKDAYLIVCRK